MSFPKSGKRAVQGVKVYPDGREKCIPMTVEGNREYRRRVEAMWYRQHGVCCLYGFLPGCPGMLSLAEATFEHEDGRGMGGGKRDDRIEKHGHPYNGVAHYQCNQAKGSTFVDYNGNRMQRDRASVSRDTLR